MIQPKPFTYDEFPASSLTVKGMRIIPAQYGAQTIEYYENVRYAGSEEHPLLLQILVPQNQTTQSYPAVIYIQGSAWYEQKIYRWLPQLYEIAKRGFVVASVQYRASTTAPFPAQICDAKTAIRYLRIHAEEYSIDPDKIVIWGDSSGGHTALMTGMTAGYSSLDSDTYSGTSEKVKGIVDFYGPTDIRRMNDAPSTMDHLGAHSPEGDLLGGIPVMENPEKAQATVVMNYISEQRKLPPILIFHGDKDRTVPFEQSVLLYEALCKADKDAIFYQLKGADHGGGAFWTEPIMDIAEKFIREAINK